jgi:hypothetical protein
MVFGVDSRKAYEYNMNWLGLGLALTCYGLWNVLLRFYDSVNVMLS